MTLADDFRAAVVYACETSVGIPELLPMALAQAVVEVLPIDGAGLSMTEELRVPLGASSGLVTGAELLQSTLGEGPCLTATAQAEPLEANAASIAERWPMFYREIVAHTPFRSVISMPLRAPQSTYVGALDLYSIDPEGPPPLSLSRLATDIAGPIATILFGSPFSTDPLGVSWPTWLNNDLVTDRLNVWVAIGMFMEHHVSSMDALAVIRGYGFSHDLTLDEVAEQITSRRLSSQTLLA